MTDKLVMRVAQVSVFAIVLQCASVTTSPLAAEAMMGTGGYDEQIAYVAREWVPATASPQFSAYVMSDDSETAHLLEETASAGSVEDALTWARARAARVVLSYGYSGDGVFSAGHKYHDGDSDEAPLPLWPPPADVLAEIDAKAARLQVPTGDTWRLGVEEPEER
jgi:hypothetical protein